MFSPKTSIYSKKAAIDSAFIYPVYRGGGGGVLVLSIGYSIQLLSALLLPSSSFIFF